MRRSLRRRPRPRPTRPSDSAHASRPVCTEPLEPRLLMAASLKLGGSGCSGTLSTNPVTRQQQLICDPNEPLAGSMSVSYDPTKVTLRDTFSNDQQQSASIVAGPGYVIDEELVEVERFGEVGSFRTLVPFNSLSDTGGSETGYLQVKFHLTGTAGQIEPDGAVVDEAGVDGVDPFAVTFNHVEPGPILTIVDGGNLAAAAIGDAVDVPPPDTTSYTIFAAGDNEHSGNAEDFFITNDGTNTRIPHDQISPATVSFTDVPADQQTASVGVVPDPGQTGRQALVAVGTDAPETIVFTKQGGGLKVSITNNDTNQTTTYGPFTGFDRVIAYGRGDDDTIRMDAQGSQSVLFFGGEGDDKLMAGNGGSILSGGGGDDKLSSGNGVDLLFGGRGLDTLNGGNGEDILVGEHTNFDEGTPRDVKDLTWMFNEWSKGGKYEVRISHLTGAPGGQNSTAFFNLSGQNKNVWDDGEKDEFAGGNGRDWIITGSSTGDVTHDKNETVSVVN